MKNSVLLLLFLAACQNVPTASIDCLPLRQWTPEEEQKLAESLSQIPDDSPISLMALEWAKLRAEIRTCEATNDR